MFICIPDILSPQQLAELNKLFDRQSFIDGRETAGWAAAGVKDNAQVASDSADYAAMQAMVGEALAAVVPIVEHEPGSFQRSGALDGDADGVGEGVEHGAHDP